MATLWSFGIYAQAPTIQSSDIIITTVTTNSVSFTLTPGDGTDQLIVMKAGSPIDQFPVDGNSYSANFSYATGDPLGNGNFIVAVGIGGGSWNSWSIGDLSPGTLYYLMAIQANGTNYLTTNATGNPISFTTLSPSLSYSKTPDVTTASFSGTTFSVATHTTEPTGLTFNNDGTKMFVVGQSNTTVQQYDLSPGFDITSSVASGSFSISPPQQASARGVAFNNDGTKMYLLSPLAVTIYEYILSSAFDVTTAAFNSELSISLQVAVPSDIDFNHDGSIMFILDLGADRVNQYSLSTEFDITSATYQKNFSVTTQELNPDGLAFSKDGTKMYMIGFLTNTVYQYSLSIPFDVESASFDLLEYSVSSQESVSMGLAFNNQGNKMFIVGSNGDNVYEYNLSNNAFTENSVNDGSVVGSILIEIEHDTFVNANGTLISPDHYSIDNLPAGISSAIDVAADGTSARLTLSGNAAMHQKDNDISDLLFEFTSLAFTNYDVADVLNASGPANSNLGISFMDNASLTYSSSIDLASAVISGSSISVIGSSLTFNPDGSKLFVLGGSNEVFEWTLGNAFDISSASFNTSFSVAAQASGSGGLAFNSDGSKMYVVDSNTKGLYLYNLGAKFDVSSATFASSISLSAQEEVPSGISFNKNGTKLFISGWSGNNIYEYALSTGFDIATAVFAISFSIAVQETNVLDVKFNRNGSKMYIVGDQKDEIFEYTLSAPFNISSPTLTGSFSVGSFESTPTGLTFNAAGTKLYIIGTANSEVLEFNLSNSVFKESIVNNGTVTGSLIINIDDDTFVNGGGSLTSPTHFTIPNLPIGLTPLIAINSNGTSGTLTLSGNATDHFNIDDISDLQFTFTNAAFTNSTASGVFYATGPASSNLGIDFNDQPPPTITSFSPTSGTVGTSVAITGTNFSTTASNNIVYFGATKATVTNSTATEISVTVPGGATYDPVSVTTSRLTVQSSGFFTPTFLGNHSLIAENFVRTEYPSGLNPYNIQIGDIDGDGKSEIMVTNFGETTLSLYKNNSTAGAISFASKFDIDIGTSPDDIDFEDLDRDGKRDIVVGYQGGIFVLRNNSASSAIDVNTFESKVSITNNGCLALAVGDIDRDGKPDIVSVSNGIGYVFRNNSTLGSFNVNSFESPLSFNLPSGGSGDVEIADFDQDGRLDIITANQNSSNLSLIRNLSSPGNITLETRQDISTSAGVSDISIADVNYDGLNDVLMSMASSAEFGAFENVTSTTTFEFNKQELGGNAYQVSLDAGDLNGDGMVDAFSVARSIYINNSSGSISFNLIIASNPGSQPQDIEIGDLDNDGRPDVAIADRIDNQVYVYHNISYPEPSAQPTNMTFTDQQPTSFTVNFTAASGNPDGYIAFMREGSSPAFVPVDGTEYIFNEEPDPVGESGTFTVLNDVFTSFGIVSVTPGATLYFDIYAYNGSGTTVNYLTSSPPLEGSFTTPTLPPEPTAQPTNITFTNQQSTSFTVDFNAAAGNPDGYIAFMREGSSPAFVPVDGTEYIFNEEPDPVGESGTFTVLNDVFTSFGIVSVTPGATLYFDIYAYNGSATNINYLTSIPPLEGSFTTPIQPTEPTVQASNLVITQPFVSTINVTWTNGNGTDRIVVAREGGTVNQAPVDGASYIASASFTSGDDLSGGNYVVYKGAGNSVDVTDIQEGISYSFFVFEYNGGAGTENYNINTATENPKSITTTTSDTSPPIAGTDATPTSVTSGSNVAVSAQFSDPESGVSSVDLNYRSISGGGNYTQVAMTLSGNNWQAQIPSSAVGELGVEYELDAANGAGLHNSPVLKVVRVTTSSNGLSIPYSSPGSAESNYRIIAVPLNLTDNKVSDVFDELMPYDDTKWRMFRYQSAANQELNGTSIIEPGKGYWLIVKDGKTLNSGEGITVQASSVVPFSIPLVQGWNQIGNPYNFNLSWADVQAANAGLPGLRNFTGTFGDATELNKMEGGFINAASAGTLVFPVVKNPAVNGRQGVEELPFLNSIDLSNWQVYINVNHGNLMNRIAGVGMHEYASEEYDVYDGLSMPSFFGSYLDVNHTKQWNGNPFSKDIVPTVDNYMWNFSLASSGEETIMTFSWDNSYFQSSHKQLYLWDAAQQRSVDMKQESSYTFEKNLSNRFKVIFGSEDFVQKNTDVPELVLHRLWPNPAHEEVNIGFTLPRTRTDHVVNLEMVDMMGRKARNISRSFPAGYNVVKWNWESEATGVYLVTIKAAGAFKQTRLVLK